MLDFSIVTAITVGLTQVTKGLIPSKFTPLLSVGVAVVLSVVWGLSQDAQLVPSLVSGLISGLSASGLYDVATKPLS